MLNCYNTQKTWYNTILDNHCEYLYSHTRYRTQDTPGLEPTHTHSHLRSSHTENLKQIVRGPLW